MIGKSKLTIFLVNVNLPPMKAVETRPKQVPVSEFKARCTEYLRVVETDGRALQITRHGKVIATVSSPSEAVVPSLLGAGKATGTLNENYDPQAPAFDEDDWEINR